MNTKILAYVVLEKKYKRKCNCIEFAYITYGETKMSMTEDITGMLMFKKASMEKIANNVGSTTIALILIIVSALIAGASGIYQYLTANINNVPFGFASLNDYKNFLLTGVVTEILVYLLFAFIFSGIMGFVLRGFGGTATLIQCLRVLGFTELFSIIGSILNFIVTLAGQPTIGMDIGSIFALITLIAFIIGLTSFSGVSIVTSIVAVIIAAIIAVVIAVIIVIILIAVLFAAIISSLSSATIVSAFI